MSCTSCQIVQVVTCTSKTVQVITCTSLVFYNHQIFLEKYKYQYRTILIIFFSNN